MERNIIPAKRERLRDRIDQLYRVGEVVSDPKALTAITQMIDEMAAQLDHPERDQDRTAPS